MNLQESKMITLVPTKVFLTKGVGRHKYQLKSFEAALRQANQRFRERFAYMEEACQRRGVAMQELSLEQLDELWEEAKKKV